MASARVYYDAANPRMLTEEEILRLSPAECQVVCNQIDANLVGVLQEIDESLSQSNLIVTQDILPAVQRYGENSQRIWESVKFWKSFFEAAANTKLNDPYTADDSIRSDHTVQADHGAGAAPGSLGDSPGSSADQSLAFSNSDDGDASNASESRQGTPKWSDHIDPFQALKADLESVGINTSASSNASAVSQSAREIAALRARNHLDSFAVPDDDDDDLAAPELETLHNLDAFLPTRATAASKGKGRAFNPPTPSSASPQPRLRAGADKHHPLLLHKLLQKNAAASLASGPPTPRATAAPQPSTSHAMVFPPGVSTGWDGIADLSLTPMSAFTSPVKRRADQSELSPPPNMSFSFSPAPYSRTPAKEAARRMTRDVYADEFSDSPLPSPPSVVKQFGTRTYDHYEMSLGEAGRPGFEEEAFDEEGDEGEEEASFDMENVAGALADFGGGTTARIEDLLLHDNSFAKVVDDDEEDRRRSLLDEDEDDEYTAGSGLHSHSPVREEEEDQDLSYVEEGQGLSPIVGDGPEDTLFGIGASHRSYGRAFDEGEDGSFDGVEEGASRFRVLGHVDETLHGGQLLDSEPFEASPLAGRCHGGGR